MPQRYRHIAECRRNTPPYWAAGSRSSFTMGLAAEAWVGRTCVLANLRAAGVIYCEVQRN